MEKSAGSAQPAKIWNQGSPSNHRKILYRLAPFCLFTTEASSALQATQCIPLPQGHQRKKQGKHAFRAIHCTGRKSMTLPEKTTLIINLANWNTLQNQCYKSSIYTKSGGWRSCDCREGKHERLPGREARSHLDSPSSHLIQCSFLVLLMRNW